MVIIILPSTAWEAGHNLLRADVVVGLGRGDLVLVLDGTEHDQSLHGNDQLLQDLADVGLGAVSLGLRPDLDLNSPDQGRVGVIVFTAETRPIL